MRSLVIAEILVLSCTLQLARAFTAVQPGGWMPVQLAKHSAANQRKASVQLLARQPSRVTEEFGPTPDVVQPPIEEVDVPEEFLDLEELPPGPIPHQPWRRGETGGCEDPITAEWRVKAEDLIYTAVKLAGGKALDVTWYLTSVLVTLDEDMSQASDMFAPKGPIIEVKHPRAPLYYDPNDPNPEEIWVDGDEIVYERETPEEAEERKQKKQNMYATKDEDDPEDEAHIPIEDDDREAIGLYMNEETRADAALTEIMEVTEAYEKAEKPLTRSAMTVDKTALSNIAGGIIDVLEEVEDELRILSRHELVLASRPPPDTLETQKQFNAHRGKPVMVETQDPWQSNRTLKGRLLDRNSMDVYINKQGRMVTIPLNFVKCVRIPPKNEGKDVEEEDEDDTLEVDEVEPQSSEADEAEDP